MWKINRELLPIKAHYFFFFAALGPILPQLSVFGKQMGVPPHIMGIVTAILPLLWATAKGGFGYLADYFQAQRKMIFIGLILLMMVSYCSMYFLPEPPYDPEASTVTWNLSKEHGFLKIRSLGNCLEESCTDQEHLLEATCHWTCEAQTLDEKNSTTVEWNFRLERNFMSNNTEAILVYTDRSSFECSFFDMDDSNEIANTGEAKIDKMAAIEADKSLNRIPKSVPNTNISNPDLDRRYHKEGAVSTTLDHNASMFLSNETDFNTDSKNTPIFFERQCIHRNKCDIFSCVVNNSNNQSSTVEEFHLYSSLSFWGFVLLMSVGTVAFNVANSISDAVCFDILGPDRLMTYGSQRVWGTIGYGITALASGIAVDMVSTGLVRKIYYPAFILAAVFTIADLRYCWKLKLTGIQRHKSAGKALATLLSRPPLVAFLIFAVIIGTLDSFIIYYLFWFLEELATETGDLSNIKLLEGVSVASNCFGGEVLFFIISGKILKRFGYKHTLTFSLACYAIELFLISFISSPWEIIIIGFIFQGPTYALGYSTIVGYAAAIAPEGLSATLQGIVAGMDDGVGFTIGSLLGGFLYKAIGGRMAFRLFGCLAAVSTILHIFISRAWVTESQNDDHDLNVARETETFIDHSTAAKTSYGVISSKEQSSTSEKENSANI